MTGTDGFDVVIIGAGLGGLTAGAVLARAGRAVKVIEQHTIPGGCATTFGRRDFEMEVSLHEIEGLDEHDIKREIFAELDVFDAIDFEPVSEFYRYVRGSDEVVVPHGGRAAVDRLVGAFPHEAAGIERFFDVITSIRESMASLPLDRTLSLPAKAAFGLRHRRFVRHRNATLGGFLDEIVDDDALKLVLTANLGYYHDDAYSLSLPFFSAAQAGYFVGGGHYIKGGSQRLSDHLAAVIEDHGGIVETGRLATAIQVAGGSASGVRHEATRTGRDPCVDPAGTVIANAAIPLVADRLLPDPHGSRLAERIADWERSPSITTLYLGFGTPPRDLGCRHYSTVIQHESVETMGDAAGGRPESFGRRSLTFVDYSQVEADLAPEGMAVGVVSTIDYRSEWAGLTDQEYRQKKARVKDVLLRRLGELYPRLPDAIEHAELATPKTIERYTLNPGGSPYGFAQTPSQSLLDRRIDAPVEDLLFASAWTFPGGGFTGAMVAGYRAGRAALRERDRGARVRPRVR